MDEAKQVFILGAPRSGTTFLASLLARTRFKAPFETHFIPKYYKKLTEYGDLNQFSNFSSLLDDILSERAVMQWKLNLKYEVFFTSFNGHVSYDELVDKLCSMKRNDNGDGCWGEKTPWYLQELGVIYELFPNAKYIYIVRDGRDVALSLLKKEWGPNNIYACAEYWRTLNKESPILAELKEKGQLLELRYEDLLDDTEEYVQRFYEFLAEPYDRDSLDSLVSTAKAGNYNKWKENLSDQQIKLFDSVAANTLSRFGYETFEKEAALGVLARNAYIFQNKLIWLKFMFKTNVIDGFKIKFLGKEPFVD